MFSRFSLLLLCLPAFSHAHGLSATATLTEGRVVVKCFYDDDESADDALVRVEDENKQRIAEGRTDKAGQWSFPTPPAGRYRILVDAGGGHRATIHATIPADAQNPGTVSDGPSREQFTRFPALGLGVGLGLLALLGLLVPWLLRRMKSTQST